MVVGWVRCLSSVPVSIRPCHRGATARTARETIGGVPSDGRESARYDPFVSIVSSRKDQFRDNIRHPDRCYRRMDASAVNTSSKADTNYAGVQHSLQFCYFSFSVVVQGDHARFLRWDLSQRFTAFDYHANPKLMVCGRSTISFPGRGLTTQRSNKQVSHPG